MPFNEGLSCLPCKVIPLEVEYHVVIQSRKCTLPLIVQKLALQR